MLKVPDGYEYLYLDDELYTTESKMPQGLFSGYS